MCIDWTYFPFQCLKHSHDDDDMKIPGLFPTPSGGKPCSASCIIELHCVLDLPESGLWRVPTSHPQDWPYLQDIPLQCSHHAIYGGTMPMKGLAESPHRIVMFLGTAVRTTIRIVQEVLTLRHATHATCTPNVCGIPSTGDTVDRLCTVCLTQYILQSCYLLD
jgi:hypothetical protein